MTNLFIMFYQVVVTTDQFVQTLTKMIVTCDQFVQNIFVKIVIFDQFVWKIIIENVTRDQFVRPAENKIKFSKIGQAQFQGACEV